MRFRIISNKIAYADFSTGVEARGTTPEQNAALFRYSSPVTLTFDVDIRTRARFLYTAPNR